MSAAGRGGRPSEPLRFRPIFKEKVWGGRRLETALGKRLPGPGPYGECWEISDCGEDLSAVDGGPWDGLTLADLLRRDPEAVLGRPGGSFPLLFKTIDASDILSVQLHPGEEDSATGRPGVRSKTEAWVILDADPGARIVYGLVDGARREDLLDRADAGDTAGVEELLAWKEVRAGDVAFIPAGTIHAIGAGILLLEIQQSSDTTYRIHDWGRPGLDGRPRSLHLREAREVMARPPALPCPYASLRDAPGPLSTLVACEPFRIDALRLDGGRPRAAIPSGPAPGFGVIVGFEGRAEVRAGGRSTAVARGDFVLVPALADQVEVRAEGGDFTGLWVQEGRRGPPSAR